MTRLKYERTRRGLSQQALGDAVGIHQEHVSMIERGQLIPTDDQLRSLSLHLEVPSGELLKEVVIVAAGAAQ